MAESTPLSTSRFIPRLKYLGLLVAFAVLLLHIFSHFALVQWSELLPRSTRTSWTFPETTSNKAKSVESTAEQPVGEWHNWWPEESWIGLGLPAVDTWITGKSSLSRQQNNSWRCSESRFKRIMPTRLPVDLLGRSGTLVVRCTGGLNQQRFQIVLAAVVARLANAELSDPQLQRHKGWNDTSSLSEIFDVQFLREKLAPIIKFAPEDSPLKSGGELTPPLNAPHVWWERTVPALLNRLHTIEIPTLHKRLNMSTTSLPQPIRYLWCYVNFHALKFVDRIEQLAARLHDRLGGNYVAVHLRLEEDMLAKLGPACLPRNLDANLKAKLAVEITAFARRVWGEEWKGIDADRAQQRGKCPMTERQVIEVLLALGMTVNNTVYIAGGTPHPVFRSVNSTIEALRQVDPKQQLPRVVRKEELLTIEERGWLRSNPSQAAAVDYLLSLYADVFVRTIGGNMGHHLSMHRSYLGRYTLFPDREALQRIAEFGWSFGMKGFASEVRKAHRGTDLRWLNQPAFTSGKNRSKYMDARVDASSVALGLDSEARSCLCSDGTAGTDSALYREALEHTSFPSEPLDPLLESVRISDFNDPVQSVRGQSGLADRKRNRPGMDRNSDGFDFDSDRSGETVAGDVLDSLLNIDDVSLEEK